MTLKKALSIYKKNPDAKPYPPKLYMPYDGGFIISGSFPGAAVIPGISLYWITKNSQIVPLTPAMHACPDLSGLKLIDEELY